MYHLLTRATSYLKPCFESLQTATGLKSIKPLFNSSSAMLVFLRFSRSATIRGCAPNKSCLLLWVARMTNCNLDTIPGHSASVLSLGTLLLTSTIPVIVLYPPLTGSELNPGFCLVYLLIRVLAFTVCSRNDNVVPFN